MDAGHEDRRLKGTLQLHVSAVKLVIDHLTISS